MKTHVPFLSSKYIPHIKRYKKQCYCRSEPITTLTDGSVRRRLYCPTFIPFQTLTVFSMQLRSNTNYRLEKVYFPRFSALHGKQTRYSDEKEWKKNGWWRATPFTWYFGSTGPR